MLKEVGGPIVDNLPAITLFLATVSSVLKQKLKSLRPDINPKDLEIHHIRPMFMGGNGDQDNLMAVTRVEHAIEHYDNAMHTTGDESRGHWWSVWAIVRRMNEKEIKEFNQKIKGRR